MKWRAYFIEGFAVLFPFVLSIVILVFLTDFFSYPVRHLLLHFTYHRFVVRVVSLALSLFLITLIGFLARRWLLSFILRGIRIFFRKTPLVRNIYHICHQIVHSLARKPETTNWNVVTFPYGDTNGYVVGLVPHSDNTFEGHVPILHTGPSPLHCLILIVDEEKLVKTMIPIEDAVRWSLSVGSTPLKNK